MNRKQALTVVELLVVTVIVILLSTILLGVFRLAVKESHWADATSRGRQMYLGLSLYHQDYGSEDSFPSYDRLVDSGYISEPALGKVIGDPFSKGQAGEAISCPGQSNPVSLKYPISWFQLNASNNSKLELKPLLSDLNAEDDNHGIFTLLVYGNRAMQFSPTRCQEMFYIFKGPSLLVRKDGAVSRVQIEPEVKIDSNGVEYSMCALKLFTGWPNVCFR